MGREEGCEESAEFDEDVHLRTEMEVYNLCVGWRCEKSFEDIPTETGCVLCLLGRGGGLEMVVCVHVGKATLSSCSLVKKVS